MTLCCFKCGKQIKGKATIVTPPLLLVRAIGAFEKAYHPACYAKSEKEAEKELHGGQRA